MLIGGLIGGLIGVLVGAGFGNVGVVGWGGHRRGVTEGVLTWGACG